MSVASIGAMDMEGEVAVDVDRGTGRAAWPFAASLVSAGPAAVALARAQSPNGRLRHALASFQAGFAAAIERERDHGTPFLFVPVFLGIGAWAWFALPYQPSPIALCVALFLGAIAVFARRGRAGGMVFCGHMLFCMLAGMTLAAAESLRLSTVVLDQPVTTTVTGRILSREADDRGRIRYRIELTATDDPTLRRPPATITLLARSPHAPMQVGDSISGRARLNPPSGPALPGLNDFAFDAYFSGTGAIGFFYGKPLSAPRSDQRENWPLTAFAEAIAGWRSAITERIRGQIGGDAGAIAAALVTAEQRGISPKTVEALRQAGLAHVLAISGLNMVLAAGTFLVGARLALALVPGAAERLPVKKIAAIGGLLTVTLYILVSGGAVSAIRSWLMIVVMLVAVLFDRNAISLRNIALSAIVILAVTPSAVTGPGFQMSYAATLGLVAGYAAWRERPSRIRRPTGGWRWFAALATAFLGGLLLSSLIGGVATLVYSVGHFHRIPAYGLAGNLLAMPIISVVIMPMAVIAMLLMPLGLDGLPLAIMGRGIEWIIATADWVSGWGGEIVTGRLSSHAFALIAAGGGMMCLFRTRFALLAAIPCAAGIALVLLGDPAPAPQLLVSEDARLVALVHDRKAATNRPQPPDFIYDQWRRALRIVEHMPPVAFTAADGKQPAFRRSVSATGRNPAAITAPASTRTSAVMHETRTATGRTNYHPGRTGLASQGLVSEGRAGEGRAGEALPDHPAVARRAAADMRAALAIAQKEKRFVCQRKRWCAGMTEAGWRVIWLEDPLRLAAACESADFIVSTRYRESRRCRSQARLITAGTLQTTGAIEIAPAEAEERTDAGKSAAASPSGEPRSDASVSGQPRVTEPGSGPAISAQPYSRQAAPVSSRGEAPVSSRQATPDKPAADNLKTRRNARAYRIRQAVVGLERPWNRHRLYDWRSDTYLPPARAAEITGEITGSGE